MTYNPNDIIAYMPAIGTSLWLAAITLASTAAFFYFFKGTSITFWLASTNQGQALLACNNYALGSQITSITLNHIIPGGLFKGQSVAFWLAMTSRLIPDLQVGLLAHNDFALGSQITPATLNHIIPIGAYQGQSVAFYLAKSPKGRALLAHNNCSLGKLIINRRERAHRFFSLPDDIQPYFQDPKLLRQFLQSMPGRRNDIITEASEHVARLRSISRSATTCSALRSQHLNQMESTNSFDDLDSYEHHTFFEFSTFWLSRQSSDSNTLPCSTTVPTPN